MAFITLTEAQFLEWADKEFGENEYKVSLPNQGYELVIAAPVKGFESLEYHIYTTVESRKKSRVTRDLGTDAIRPVLYDIKSGCAVVSGTKVLRTEADTTPFERLTERIKELYLVAAQLQFCTSSRCGCGAHLVKRINKTNGGEFMGCAAYPIANQTSALRARYPLTNNPLGLPPPVKTVYQGQTTATKFKEAEPAVMTDLVADEDCIPTSAYPYREFPFPTFNRVQSTIMRENYWAEDCNLVLGTTTSSGKTVSAELFLAETLHRKQKVIYVSPLKALTQEKFEEWGTRYAEYDIAILTGDYVLTPANARKLANAHIICLTSEMIDSRTRNFQSEKSEWMFDVGLIIIDETHIISTNRGHAVEAGLMRFTKLVPDARVLLLSATMPNVEDFRKWCVALNGKRTEVINSDWRPTNLHWHFIEHPHQEPKTYHVVQDYKKKQALELVLDKPDEKFLVFVHDKNTGRQLERNFNGAGIETHFHNADLNFNDRIEIERKFADRKEGLRVMISTSTLAWGRTLPARNVVITGIHRGIKEVDELDIIQMAGRAGRLGVDPEGDCFLICDSANRWKNIIKNPRNVISTMLSTGVLGFHILAEVKNGEILDQQTLDVWFSRTLARIQINSENIDPKLVDAVLAELIEWNMLRVIDGKFEITRLGRVSASLYYWPEDVHHWSSMFGLIDKHNLWESDLALAYALGTTPTMSLGYVPRNEMDNVMGFCDAVQSIWPSRYIKQSVIATDLYDLLTIGKASVYVKSIQFDMERICGALQWIDGIRRWNKDKFWQAVPIRIRYGIGPELVQLVQIPDVGPARARKLHAAGITSLTDLIQNRGKVESALGRPLATKVIKAANAIRRTED